MSVTTDYEIELGKIDFDLNETSGNGLNQAGEREEATRRAFRHYQRASLTGRLTDFQKAAQSIDEAIARFGSSPDLAFLKASYHFKFHRLSETRNTIQSAPELADSVLAKALLADVAFQ